MKITKKILQEIIKEELEAIQAEEEISEVDAGGFKTHVMRSLERLQKIQSQLIRRIMRLEGRQGP